MTVPAHSPCHKAYETRQTERRMYQEANQRSNALQIEARRQQEAYIEAEGGTEDGIRSILNRNE